MDKFKNSYYFYQAQISKFDKQIEKLINEIVNELSQLHPDLDEGFVDLVKKVVLDVERKDLVEVKLIYLHKHVERFLKDFLYHFSKNESIRSYKFKDLKTEYKKYDVDLSKINFFDSIRELIEISNAIKHSQIEDYKKIINPIEFRNQNIIDYEVVNKFYNRTRVESFSFIWDLITYI